MGRQSFGDESKRKNRPHSKHYVEDKFGKGTTTRNWKEAEHSAESKKLSTQEEEESSLEEEQDEDSSSPDLDQTRH